MTAGQAATSNRIVEATLNSRPAPYPPSGNGLNRKRHGAAVVMVWELDKLAAQTRTRLAFAVCLFSPFAFIVTLRLADTVPADTLFGRWVGDSGSATPLVVLGFAASWGFPLLVCLVAGDIFSAEDQFGTWKTLLTRSRSRRTVFAGKALAAGVYTIAMLIVLAGSSLAAGLVVQGAGPLVGLSGNVIPAGHATVLIVEAWATTGPPCLAFAALGILLSVASRNSLVAIVGPVMIGLLMQFASLIDGIEPLRRALLSTYFLAWHGLFTDPRFVRPIADDVVVSTAYVVGCLLAAWLLFRRRDITGR